MSACIKSGVAEFDDILGGGLPANRVYLLHGTPGAGKTTLSMQFLLQGVREGDKVLYITLSETKQELLATAKSHGWDLTGVEIFELMAQETDLEPENQYTMFHSAEIELSETTKAIIQRLRNYSPRAL